jgi:hypothetical protein
VAITNASAATHAAFELLDAAVMISPLDLTFCPVFLDVAM